MHALVIDNQIQSVGGLPASARRLDARDWVMGLATAPPDLVKATGWLPVVEELAPLGADQHHGAPTYTVRANDVLAGYPAVDDPAEEKAARLEAESIMTLATPARITKAKAIVTDALLANPTNSQSFTARETQALLAALLLDLNQRRR